ncbi:MAG: cytochrome c [Steroidobacteraceae bacterium]|jgi:cytochrome c556|nr:cytochrome c [Steroidobacteraceae bacterium]
MKHLFRSPRTAVLAVAALVALPIAAVAQAPDKAAQTIKYRQAALTLLGWNITPIGAMMKGEIPFDAKKVELHATRLQQVAPMIVEGFPPGTQTGAPNKAKPEIWSNMDDFKAKAADLEKASAGLVAAARTGDQKQVGQALGAVGNTCKACHDAYRAK